jgi:hypothetical protein
VFARGKGNLVHSIDSHKVAQSATAKQSQFAVEGMADNDSAQKSCDHRHAMQRPTASRYENLLQ